MGTLNPIKIRNVHLLIEFQGKHLDTSVSLEAKWEFIFDFKVKLMRNISIWYAFFVASEVKMWKMEEMSYG